MARSVGILQESTHLECPSTTVRALLEGALLEGSLLEGTLLKGTLLEGTLLKGSLLERSLLEGALLEGAVLKWPLLEGPKTRSNGRDLGQWPRTQGNGLAHGAMAWRLECTLQESILEEDLL